MSGYGVSGVGIVSGTIFHPAEGTWSAEVEVHSGEAMSGAQTLQLPGLDLVGVIVGGGVSDLRQKLRLVGGRGGLSKALAGQHFQQATVRTIVTTLLNGAGERLDAQSDATVLAQQLEHWQHLAGSAGHGLELLCRHIGSTWYVAPNGDVHIGAPSWTAHEPDHVLLHEDLKAGTYEISSTDETVQPGTTFLGQRVSAVEHTISPGQARSFVRWGSTMHPYDEELQRAVRRHQVFTLPQYGAVIETVNSDGTLDLKPAKATDVGPGWKKIPLYLVGAATVKPSPGDRCVVEFLDNDRDQPFVCKFIASSFQEISETATNKIEQKAPNVDVGNSGAAVTLAGGTKPVARVGDVPTGLLDSLNAPVTGTIGVATPSTVKA